MVICQRDWRWGGTSSLWIVLRHKVSEKETYQGWQGWTREGERWKQCGRLSCFLCIHHPLTIFPPFMFVSLPWPTPFSLSSFYGFVVRLRSPFSAKIHRWDQEEGKGRSIRYGRRESEPRSYAAWVYSTYVAKKNRLMLACFTLSMFGPFQEARFLSAFWTCNFGHIDFNIRRRVVKGFVSPSHII